MLSCQLSFRAWATRHFQTRASAIVVFCLLFLAPVVSGQFKAPSPVPTFNDSSAREPGDAADLAVRSIEALKRLEKLVPVHASRAAFEENPGLSTVPFAVLKAEVESVVAEIQPLLCQLPNNPLKMQIVNALYSYRDGLYWLNKIDQRRVVQVAALSFREATQTPSNAAYSVTIPYTVAIHWRNASKFLKRAQALMSRSKVR